MSQVADDYHSRRAQRDAAGGNRPVGPLQLVLYPDKRLREPAQEITAITPEVLRMAHDMAQTMYSAQGVGLAAQQVGFDGRMIIIDPWQDGREPTIAINPRIVEHDGYYRYDEGCLSIPKYYCEVERAGRLTVEYVKPTGEEVREQIEGFHAVVFQHEIDHLDGILFPDRIGKLKRALFLKDYGLERHPFHRPESLADQTAAAEFNARAQSDT